jgi:hypothetical protein
VAVVCGVPDGSVSVTVADAMPFDVPACNTVPFKVNGGDCAVVVVVAVVGVVDVDGLQATTAAQRTLIVMTRRANCCEASISRSYPGLIGAERLVSRLYDTRHPRVTTTP